MRKILKNALYLLLVFVICSLGIGQNGCPLGVGYWTGQDEETLSGSSFPLPSAVSNLKAVELSDTEIELTWSDNSNNESSFGIERRTNSVWTEIDTVEANTTEYIDTGLDIYATYAYRICAYNANGYSMYSNEAFVIEPPSDYIGTWAAMTLVGSPSARVKHTGIWTGNEMIIWGGSGAASSGGRYNPLMDTWMPTSLVNAPSDRHTHTAVWTGSKMVIWGGYDWSSPVLNTGGLYDPSTNSWSDMSISNAPIPRKSHTAVWSGNKMVVWGGLDSANNKLNTGGVYNPLTDTWTQTSMTNEPEARCEHTCVWAGDKMIVWGGIDSSNNRLNTGGIYDPSTDSWSSMSIVDAPSARNAHVMVWTGEKLIVWGGVPWIDTGSIYDPEINKGGIYDLAADTWSELDNGLLGPDPRRHAHTGVWTGNEMIVWGGYPKTCTGGVYNPSTKWLLTSLDDVLSARHQHIAVWTGDSMIIWGGEVNEGSGGVFSLSSGNPGQHKGNKK